MSKIPICPLMSAGNDITIVCAQENCAWYMKNYKTCSVYLMGHNAREKACNLYSKEVK